MKKSKFILAVLIVLLSCGCSPLITKKQKQRYLEQHCKSSVVIKDSIYTNNIEKITYDTIVLPPDSSVIEMLLVCDSNNNVLIKQLNEVKGKKIETKVIFRDNKIYVKTVLNKDYVLSMMREKIREYVKDNSSYVSRVIYRDRVPGWLWFLFGVVIVIVWFRRQILKLALTALK